MKNLIIAALGVFAIALSAFSFSANANAETNKKEVEKIIEQYILNNPEKILQSVNDYQTKGVSDRQKQAMQANERKLFNNSMTPVAGNPKGDIVVVEFFDYNCGYCKKVYTDVTKLIDTDKGVKVVMKEFPILGPTSETAARWALAAHKQDKYMEFHGRLMSSKSRVNEGLLKDIAKDLGLDIAKIEQDAQSEDITDYINQNRALAQQLGVSGTPGFIFKDEVVPGAIGFDEMTRIVAEKRAAAAKN